MTNSKERMAGTSYTQPCNECGKDFCTHGESGVGRCPTCEKKWQVELQAINTATKCRVCGRNHFAHTAWVVGGALYFCPITYPQIPWSEVDGMTPEEIASTLQKQEGR